MSPKSLRGIACAPAVAVLLAVASSSTCAGKPDKIRQPAAAGTFYPADPGELTDMVEGLLDAVPAQDIPGRLIAVISPHAGYAYSGPVAAHTYALLRNRKIERVVVISPSHVAAFDGAAVYDGAGYATPLGVLPVDTEFAKRLADSSKLISLSGSGHDHARHERGEHALEVQLPFLQVVLGEFSLVPIVMGDQRYETCRALGVALAGLIDGPGTIVVASSDLSHFHDYDEAVRLDQKVVGAVGRFDYYTLSRNFAARKWEACGGGPIVAAMMAAERLGANEAVILDHANSGDVPGGDRNRVVGYMSAALVADPSAPAFDSAIDLQLSGADKERLLDIARRSVESVVVQKKMIDVGKGSGALAEELGAFVTLNEHGQLRGCIGYVVPTAPLCETVRDVAAFAAVRDRRFDPVSKGELDDLEYEISVLSPIRRVTDFDKIVVGKHGLIVKRGDREGLLLPQVAAERDWDRETFLQQTCRKAGLPPDAWRDPDTDVFAFTALVFGDHSAE